MPRTGELSPDVLRRSLGKELPYYKGGDFEIPPRPPVLCAGCPHRLVFHVLKKHKLIVTGDIGCYTLGALSPLSSMDTCVCMGASIGAASGVLKALGPSYKNKVAAVIGDSTFVHSGITGLIDAVYNRSNTLNLILDNRTTAMTGGQHHPATGRNLNNEETHELDIEGLCRAVGVKKIDSVDPYDLEGLEKAVAEHLAYPGTSVIIAKRNCVLIDRRKRPTYAHIEPSACEKCGLCLQIACPAIDVKLDGKGEKLYYIDRLLCDYCGLCEKVCKFGAIKEVPNE